MCTGMRDVAERYSRREDTLHRSNLVDPVLELPESDLQPAGELARLRCGRQSACHPLVQAPSNDALEIASGSMQRRLGYIEPPRRRLERSAFCDRGESTDVRIGDLVLDRFC